MGFRLLEEVLFITVVKYLVSKGADMFPSPLGVPIYKLKLKSLKNHLLSFRLLLEILSINKP